MKGNERFIEHPAHTSEHLKTEENLQEAFEELLLKALCSRVPVSFLLNESEA